MPTVYQGVPRTGNTGLSTELRSDQSQKLTHAGKFRYLQRSREKSLVNAGPCHLFPEEWRQVVFPGLADNENELEGFAT